MTDYSAVILDIEDHCGKCKIGEALRLLREIQAEFAPAVEAVHREPQKTVKVHKSISKSVKVQRKPSDPGDPKTRTEKACNKCGQVKPLDGYPKSKVCADGFAGTCKICTADRARQHYKEKHPPDPISDRPHHCARCGKGFITKFVMDEHAKKCGVAG